MDFNFDARAVSAVVPLGETVEVQFSDGRDPIVLKNVTPSAVLKYIDAEAKKRRR